MKIWVLMSSICLVFSSCYSAKNKAIDGSWSIDEIHYEQYDINRCMLVNIVDFHRGSCKIPDTSNCEDEFLNNRIGTWELMETDNVPLVLIINSSNVAFNGEFKVIFEADRVAKLFRMVLVSESTFISLRKGLFDFDREIEDYSQIIEFSQRGLK